MDVSSFMDDVSWPTVWVAVGMMFVVSIVLGIVLRGL